MQLGVKTGMVRPMTVFHAAIFTFKQRFSKIAKEYDPNAVLSESFAENYLKAEFSDSLSKDVMVKWEIKYNKTFVASVNESLVQGNICWFSMS